ncbi:MAG TPA: hypothetical protein VK427_23490 [Kofleriaceae bacterium]|nr:hypothetical protein [Kofleriaceae bacterium]
MSACARDGKDDKPHTPNPPVTAPAQKENRVFEVKSSGDLVNAGAKYTELLDAGFSGMFEIHVADGSYADTRWMLGRADKSAPQAIDIVLKGTGTAIPGPSKIAGQNIRIEGLVITSQQFAPIEIEATKSVTISSCNFIEGRPTNAEYSRPYLEIRARGTGSEKTPITATVENTWFVRNFQAANNSSLLAFTVFEPEPGYFNDIAIRDSAFLGNAFSADVVIGYAMNTRIQRTIFYKTWPSGVFLRCKTSDSIKLEDSVMVAEDLGQLAEVDDCPTIKVTNTKIYARSFTAGAKPPKALDIDRDALSDRTRIDAAVVDSAITMPRAAPNRDLRRALENALHLAP